MAGPGDLHALAVEVLDAAAGSLDTIPNHEPHLLGAPTRQFVSPGTPVHDCCDQLCVYVAPQIGEGDTTPGGMGAGKRFKLGRINHVAASISITRCIPTDLEPPADSLTDAAEQLNADAWALWNDLYNQIRSGELLTLCQEVFFDGITPISPSGGCAGWLVLLRIELGGYSE
jgi:hypothetical protein